MADTQKSRDGFLFAARLAEQTKRFDDMVEAMNSIAKLGVELNAEERNLLSVGYKNVLGAKRASQRIISVIKSKEEASGNMQHVALANESLKRVESELSAKCNEILSTIDKYLLPLSKTGEAAVFYQKMKGDYYRYLAEFTSDADRQEATSQSLKAYEAATAIAESHLPPTNPVRLGLALSFSVFHYAIMANTERAFNMAKQAFADAAAELDMSYEDRSVIMQLIGDNITTLWTPKSAEDEDNAPALTRVVQRGQRANSTGQRAQLADRVEEKWSIDRVHAWLLNSVVALGMIKDSIADEIDLIGKDLETRNPKSRILVVPEITSGFKVFAAATIGIGTFLAAVLSKKKWPRKFSWPLLMCVFGYALGWFSQVALLVCYCIIKYSKMLTAKR